MANYLEYDGLSSQIPKQDEPGPGVVYICRSSSPSGRWQVRCDGPAHGCGEPLGLFMELDYARIFAGALPGEALLLKTSGEGRR